MTVDMVQMTVDMIQMTLDMVGTDDCRQCAHTRLGIVQETADIVACKKEKRKKVYHGHIDFQPLMTQLKYPGHSVCTPLTQQSQSALTMLSRHSLGT